MFFGLIIIIIGVANILIGAFTNLHYEWFMSRLQQELWGKTASRITGVIAGIAFIVLGIFFIIERA